jgi:hypothetical protein
MANVSVPVKITTINNVVYSTTLSIPGVGAKHQEVDTAIYNYFSKQGFISIAMPGGVNRIVSWQSVLHVEYNT